MARVSVRMMGVVDHLILKADNIDLRMAGCADGVAIEQMLLQGFIHPIFKARRLVAGVSTGSA